MRDVSGARAGSSPHTRGALRRTPRAIDCARIIPAYAGSTSLALVAPPTEWDHPRIRGEHSGNDVRELEPRGSSPHTRGAQAGKLSEEECIGIIPAYAGSTAAFPRRAPRSPDHPRIRGEHPSNPLRSLSSAGSSPHTRGARPPGASARSGRRIIPAYAGSTTTVIST